MAVDAVGARFHHADHDRPDDTDWYRITVPATTTGTMVVRMQSTNLSLLSPGSPSTTRRGRRCWGRRARPPWATRSRSRSTMSSAGQVYDIRSKGATTGDSGFGAYGLQVNFGSLIRHRSRPPTRRWPKRPIKAAARWRDVRRRSDTDGTPQDESAIPGVPTFWVYDDDGATSMRTTGSSVPPTTATLWRTRPMPTS